MMNQEERRALLLMLRFSGGFAYKIEKVRLPAIRIMSLEGIMTASSEMVSAAGSHELDMDVVANVLRASKIKYETRTQELLIYWNVPLEKGELET